MRRVRRERAERKRREERENESPRKKGRDGARDGGRDGGRDGVSPSRCQTLDHWVAELGISGSRHPPAGPPDFWPAAPY